MGYTIKIGEAVLIEDDPEDWEGQLRAEYVVNEMAHPDAPNFDEYTRNSNSRSPSYIGWAEFAREVGLYDFFFDKRIGLMRAHPGCFLITPTHALQMSASVKGRYLSNGGRPPGFWDTDEKFNEIDNGKDPQLARLLWLEWWMNYAIKNCKIPAIYNT